MNTKNLNILITAKFLRETISVFTNLNRVLNFYLIKEAARRTNDPEQAEFIDRMKQEKLDDGYLEDYFESLNCRAFLDQSTSEDSDDEDDRHAQDQELMLINNNSDPEKEGIFLLCNFKLTLILILCDLTQTKYLAK